MNNQRLFFFLLPLLAFPVFVNGQPNVSYANEAIEKAVIWRGFQHSWTYNHRIARLGDYVSLEGQEPKIIHASATGVGADSTYFTTSYSIIESKTLGFQQGKITLDLHGKEGKLAAETIAVSIPALQKMKDRKQYVTLLNGFDIMALDRADKIQMLQLDVGDAYYSKEEDALMFNVDVALAVDCQSIECSRFNQKMSYRIELHYLVIGSEEDMYTRHQLFSKHYSWDKKDELIRPPQMQIMQGEGGDRFKDATIAVKSIRIILDQAHWVAEWNNSITPIDYIPTSGKYYFSLDLLMKEWLQGMKRNSAAPKQSRFALKKKGWASINMGIVLLQFDEANIVHLEHSGSLFWEGRNINPLSSGLSLYEATVKMP
ncbi:MAG: hypothetical protein AAF502_05680 [Bacteroidota bacterium]